MKIILDDSMIKPEEEFAEGDEHAEAAGLDRALPVEPPRAVQAAPGEEREGQEIRPALDTARRVRFNPERHIRIEEASDSHPGAKPGDEIEFPLEPKYEFGRIASQTAKQVIIQHIREAEREATYDEYKGREGEVVAGVVQRIEGRNVYLELGRGIGILPQDEQIPHEHYRIGERLKALVLAVEKETRGPGIFLSRTHPKFLAKLFSIEVPEITAGTVEIKEIAREAGSRSKVAVASNDPAVDPVGSLVGQRGVRVSAVINEIGGEKIDIIEWADDPATFVSNALSPSKVLAVELVGPRREARAIVPDEQLSLAIGKGGQNVRLAAKLTGWKIDVHGPEEKKPRPAPGVETETAPEAEAPESRAAGVKEPTAEETPTPEPETEAGAPDRTAAAPSEAATREAGATGVENESVPTPAGSSETPVEKPKRKRVAKRKPAQTAEPS